MQLVNKQYIKIDRFSIFREIVVATDNQDEDKIIFFQKLLSTVMDYEKRKRQRIDDSIYIRISDLQNQEILKVSDIPIERETIINASLFALYNNDIDIAQRLTLFFAKYETLPNELGDLLDYVLENGIDMNEYLDGEWESIIYSEKADMLEKGYIYQIQRNKNDKKLALK